MTFTSFQFKDYINEALKEIHFINPTSIQQKVIPLLLDKKNLVVQSRTGSGKTHAFLLPLMNDIEDKAETQLVIVSPSRELSDQLYQVAEQIGKHAPFELRIERAFGGRNGVRQKERLKSVTPQIVIGTPGRLWDLVRSNSISLSKVKAFVIDEADMALDMGFLETIDRIAGRMPKDLIFSVFSATIPEKLRPFLKKYLENPEWIMEEQKAGVASTIRNILLPVQGRDRMDLLRQVLSIGQPYFVLIFANTIETVDLLYQDLLEKGFNVGRLHGNLPSRERKKAMRQVQHLDYQYLVSTDLAARGIDIDGVSMVINYEIPEELEFFIHRVGRTGRLDQLGTAVTFFHPDEEDAIEWLENRGIVFEQLQIKNGEWVKPKRTRRMRKDKKTVKEKDSTIQGMVHRAKKQKVKPGYKKKLKREIQSYKKSQAIQKNRQKLRQRRKENKRKNNS